MRLIASVVVALGVLLGVATSSSVAAGSRPTASCTFASINKAVQAEAKKQREKVILGRKQFKCSGGWAVAFPDVVVTKGQSDTITQVFKAKGPIWVYRDRGGKTCVSPDHQVPAPIFDGACRSN
jgi:hypothetical protein